MEKGKRKRGEIVLRDATKLFLKERIGVNKKEKTFYLYDDDKKRKELLKRLEANGWVMETEGKVKEDDIPIQFNHIQYSIPYVIVKMHPSIQIGNDVYLDLMSRIFEWANKEGLSGKKVYGFKLVTPEVGIPIQHTLFKCRVECTKEEYMEWLKEGARDL